MSDLRIKRVMRYDEIQGHFRLFRVMWEVGILGDGQGHSNMLSVAVQQMMRDAILAEAASIRAAKATP